MGHSQSKTGNILLNTMQADDYALLEPHFHRIELPARFQLHEAGQRIDHVFFPEDGKECEVGLFGREGMSEVATVMGTDHSPFEAYVQAVGISALRLPTRALTDGMIKSATMRLHLLKYAQAMTIQLSSSIAAAGQTIDQRLARWLLMFHDRVEDDIVPLTHDLIAILLNVRRPGVTEAIHSLSDDHLITATRGRIAINDRAGLEDLAAGGYGLAEAEYERLIGVALRRHPTNPHRASIEGHSAAAYSPTLS
jgi:CRP-like cAMP-binding protein